MTYQVNETVYRALVEIVEQLETVETEQAEKIERMAGRISDLETALNNVLGSFPDGEAKAHYQRVLDHEPGRYRR
jgi:hypothetical protein